MTATPIAPATTDERLAMRYVTVADATNLAAVAAELGCKVSAIVRPFAFVVDQQLVVVLASAARRPRSAELITCLSASTVRPLRSEEILLGVQLSTARQIAYMDRELLQHEELLLCVEPPLGFAATSPAWIRAELGAELISLPPRDQWNPSGSD
jgi:hypothetical protein